MNDWKLSGIGDISKVRSDGKVAEFEYPCSTNYDCSPYYSTLPPGYYKAEVWGAQGGGGSQRGIFRPCSVYGGYSVGVFRLETPTKVFVFVGGKGEDGTPRLSRGCQGGYNGGGSTVRDYESGDSYNDYNIAGGGGGSSDIRLVDTIVDDSKDSRIIVAGGSSGYSYGPAWSNKDSHGWGGGEAAGPPTNYDGNSFGTSATSSAGYKKLFGESGTYFGGAPSGGGGGGYYGGYSLGSSSNLIQPSGGGGSGFVGKVIDYKDIKKKTFAGNENFYRLDGTYGIGNPGNGAACITVLGYVLTLKSKIQQNYIPGSTISLDFTLSSMGVGEEAKIYRSINNSADTLIKTHTDDGTSFDFTDYFDLPYISGKYVIKYTTQSKSNTNTTTTFEILVTKVPQVQVLNNPKPKYSNDETIIIEVEISDDTYVNLYNGDSWPCCNSVVVVCNNLLNRIIISYEIPKSFEVGSSHNISVYAVDEFGLYSSKFSFTYMIVSNRSPDIELTNNISYLLDSRSPIEVKGNVRDYELPSKVCLHSSIDRVIFDKHDCIIMNGIEWTPFNFSVPVGLLSPGIHSLRIYSVDDRQGESNTIIHQFAFSKKFVLVCQQSCNNNLPLFNLIRNSINLIIIYI